MINVIEKCSNIVFKNFEILVKSINHKGKKYLQPTGRMNIKFSLSLVSILSENTSYIRANFKGNI